MEEIFEKIMESIIKDSSNCTIEFKGSIEGIKIKTEGSKPAIMSGLITIISTLYNDKKMLNKNDLVHIMKMSVMSDKEIHKEAMNKMQKVKDLLKDFGGEE